MASIRTNAAAALLGVSPNTLRSWERRFGYPEARRSEGGHRQFELAQLEALRQALAETHDIAAAVAIVRERGEGPASPARLQTALAAFSEDTADRLLEESQALRSVERTVESLLLPALALLDQGSPERVFALRYATGWLAAATRVAPPATREEGVLIFDAARPGRARGAARPGARAVPAPQRPARADAVGRAGDRARRRRPARFASRRARARGVCFF